mmetsp:Transcript_16932/g.19492  ORF Transcript_16932/g.19492 Transcript_16932/m.19492 type:complete len:533 (+) Transcript_16932:173-1771(+)
MAGLGRRSHYRKHLTDSVLNDFPEPKDNELIVKVVATRGSNQFDICTPSSVGSSELAILPTKFHKLVWVKRNDYVIAQYVVDDNDDKKKGGIRFMIQHILYKEQIKHLKSNNLWPKEFMNDDVAIVVDLKETFDNGIVYDQGYDIEDKMLMTNTNRIKTLTIDDYSSSSEDQGDILLERGYGILMDDDMLLKMNMNQRTTLQIVDDDISSNSEDDEESDAIVHAVMNDSMLLTRNTNQRAILNIAHDESGSISEDEDIIPIEENTSNGNIELDQEEEYEHINIAVPMSNNQATDSNGEVIDLKENITELEKDDEQQINNNKNSLSNDENSLIADSEKDPLSFTEKYYSQEDNEDSVPDVGDPEESSIDNNNDDSNDIKKVESLSQRDADDTSEDGSKITTKLFTEEDSPSSEIAVEGTEMKNDVESSIIRDVLKDDIESSSEIDHNRTTPLKNGDEFSIKKGPLIDSSTLNIAVVCSETKSTSLISNTLIEDDVVEASKIYDHDKRMIPSPNDNSSLKTKSEFVATPTIIIQ